MLKLTGNDRKTNQNSKISLATHQICKNRKIMLAEACRCRDPSTLLTGGWPGTVMMAVLNQIKGHYTPLSRVSRVSLGQIGSQKDLREDVHCGVVYNSGELEAV